MHARLNLHSTRPVHPEWRPLRPMRPVHPELLGNARYIWIPPEFSRNPILSYGADLFIPSKGLLSKMDVHWRQVL